LWWGCVFLVVLLGGFMGEGAGSAVREGEAEGLSGVGLLLLAAENLKKNTEFTVGQLNARKVRGEMKLRWSRSLVRPG
jgi:hypothetical protein